MHYEFDRFAAPIKGMLMEASDKALDKLARPGAFSTDDAIRIILPGQPDQASTLMQMADKAGMTARLQRTINDAAGMAAGQAKPIFRRAIQRMTLKDTIQILSKDHGATNYLRKSSGDELYAMLRPIIANALDRTGAYKLARLKASGALAGLSHAPGHRPAARRRARPMRDDDPLWDPKKPAPADVARGPGRQCHRSGHARHLQIHRPSGREDPPGPVQAGVQADGQDGSLAARPARSPGSCRSL